MMEDFEVWYTREHPRVLAACTALAGEVDVARDATDEAFTRALERWSKVAGMNAPGGWVQAVALNYLRRTLRRRRLERLLGAGAHAEAVPPDRELWMVVRTLPARQQTAVVLAYVHDLSGTAIAQAMGIAPGTVSSTLDAARRNLRQRLADSASSEERVRWLTS